MNRGLCAVVTLFVASWSLADTPPLVPPEVLAQIKDDPCPLPRYMTPAERHIPLPQPQRGGPPTGLVECPPEYVPNEGFLIAWQGYSSILTQMVVGSTKYDPTVTVWIVVDGASEQASVTSTLTAAGAVMSQVEFITYVCDTVWIRDYGPRFIFEDGMRAMIDHIYNRPRPKDDAIVDFLSPLWDEPQYDIPLVHGGGNFHLFSNDDAFMTDLILIENPGLTAADVKTLYKQYQNLNLTIYPGLPFSFDSTKHIDMWMLPCGNYKIIVGQYPISSGEPYTITEAAVADLISRGYTVYRTPGWKSGAHYTYTNAMVINNQVFMSKFGGSYAAQDAQALATFQAAFPGYQIYQIDSSSIIGAGGAMHCIMMHVPAYSFGPIPVVEVQVPDGGEVWIVGQPYDIVWSAYDDLGVTSIDVYLSLDGGLTFPYTIATGLADTGLYTWNVPALSSTHCRVKVVAHDADGHSGEDASNGDFTITPYGPQIVYSFPLDSSPGWSVQGQWAFGKPTGQGGTQHGYPDPTSGATGLNVYGVNLSGDYSTTVGGPYYLKTAALDLTGFSDVTLRFQRWLNTDGQPYVYATIHVSNNGTTWVPVWSNGIGETVENKWSVREYDLSATADGQDSVYLRWGYQVGSDAWAYSGWNLDDIEIIGVKAQMLGDLNCDGVVNAFDIDPFVLALTDPAGYEAAWPDCDIMNADCNQDGKVDAFDIDPFVDLLIGP